MTSMMESQERSVTEQLRELCDANRIPWSAGIYLGSKLVGMDIYTTIGVKSRSLTFVERGGAFGCMDGMSVVEAYAAGVCAWADGLAGDASDVSD